jgi:hypothetical protein
MDALASYGSSSEEEEEEAEHPAGGGDGQSPSTATTPVIAILTAEQARQRNLFARNVPHTVGNWAGHVYIDLAACWVTSALDDEEDDDEETDGSPELEAWTKSAQGWMQQLRNHLQARHANVDVLVHHDRCHVSLSKTFYIQHYNIAALVAALRKALGALPRRTLQIVCEEAVVLTNAGDLADAGNTSGNACRTFWSWRLQPPCTDLIDAVDGVLQAWRLPPFYQPPVFHTSWASAAGDWRKPGAGLVVVPRECVSVTVGEVHVKIADKEFTATLGG